MVAPARGGGRRTLATGSPARTLSAVTSAASDVPATRSRTRRIGGLVAGLLVLAFLAAAVVGGWDEVAGYDWQFHAGFLALAVCGVAGSLGCTAIGYVLILERTAGRRLPRGRLLSIWSQSMLGGSCRGT